MVGIGIQTISRGSFGLVFGWFNRGPERLKSLDERKRVRGLGENTGKVGLGLVGLGGQGELRLHVKERMEEYVIKI